PPAVRVKTRFPSRMLVLANASPESGRGFALCLLHNPGTTATRTSAKATEPAKASAPLQLSIECEKPANQFERSPRVRQLSEFCLRARKPSISAAHASHSRAC